MVHVSFDVVDEFCPRVPRNRLSEENNDINRICVTDSIHRSIENVPGCYKILYNMNELNLPLIIHGYYMNSQNIVYPNQEYVPDLNITKEAWVMSKPDKVRRIDYEIVDPKFVFQDNMVLLKDYRLKRIKFQDNAIIFLNTFKDDIAEIYDILYDFITEIGYGKFIYEVGNRWIELGSIRLQHSTIPDIIPAIKGLISDIMVKKYKDGQI